MEEYGLLMPEREVNLSRAEVMELITQNAEMRRLLAEHQWSGLTPAKSGGVCPECCGSARNGHRPGCAIDAVLQAEQLS
jgi:hypothetical protein